MAAPPQTASAMRRRMDPGDRRKLVLEAATSAFARTGYAGTSTHTVARQASISQPYVLRMFGSKLALFLEVLDQSTDRIVETLAAVIEEQARDRHDEEDQTRLGQDVGALIHEPMLVFIQGCSAAHQPVVAAATRRCASRMIQALRRTGWTNDQVRDLMAHGLLVSILHAICPQTTPTRTAPSPPSPKARSAEGRSAEDHAARRGVREYPAGLVGELCLRERRTPAARDDLPDAGE